MTATCPVCGAEQSLSLLCSSCCDRLESLLREVPSLVTELATTASKQARIGNAGGGAGLARERSPINFGAVEVADNLANVLTTWARDVTNELPLVPGYAAAALLANIDVIRRHPAVNELTDEISDAINQARRAIDRPADRTYLGQCLVPTPDDQGRDVTCLAELWAKPDATTATCKTCGGSQDVADRKQWLLDEAKPMLVTVKEASRYLGRFGTIDVTEASIRGLLHRKRIAYRPGTTTFRLGDLLNVLTDMRTKEAA